MEMHPAVLTRSTPSAQRRFQGVGRGPRDRCGQWGGQSQDAFSVVSVVKDAGAVFEAPGHAHPPARTRGR